MMFCTQCNRDVRVTEANAFGGKDKLRSTLACGHVVAKMDQLDELPIDGMGAKALVEFLDERSEARRAQMRATGMLGQIRVIPNGMEPEVFAFQNGLV